MIAEAKIEQLVRRAEAIDDRLMSPLDTETLVRLSRERAELDPVVSAIRELRATVTERNGAAALLNDPEMGAMAYEEMGRKEEAQAMRKKMQEVARKRK